MKRLSIFSSMVALAFLFSACEKSSNNGTDEAIGVKSIVWNGASDIAVAVQIDDIENSTRSNASGPKIPSNAHSADFPGVYFTWDPKQKDVGYLKVEASVFEKYRFFILTTKESNKYFDFAVIPQPGQKLTADNCYVFYIKKVTDKNINMVFVSEVKEKTNPDDPPIIVNPPVVDPNGCVSTYYIMSGPGTKGVVVDPKSKWNLAGGTDIKTYWSNTISATNPVEWAVMMGITINDQKAQWVWDRDDSWEYGISGSQLVLGAIEFSLAGTIVDDEIPFYFACDNAAIVFVNGKRVACTDFAFTGRTVPETIAEFGFSDADIDGQAWQHLYKFDLKDYLVENAFNSIQVIGANSDDNNGMYNKENNPAGLIFASTFSVKTCNE